MVNSPTYILTAGDLSISQGAHNQDLAKWKAKSPEVIPNSRTARSETCLD